MRLILLFPLILLAGCETVGGMADGPDLSSRFVRKCGESVALSGRISMHYTFSQNDRVESLHGKFTWRQKGDVILIRLFSPLGQTVAVIEVTPQQAVFIASGKPPVSAANADELVFRQLGWPLPVSGLRHWLQGCATGPDGTFFQASPARPETMTQDGWHLHYVSWTPLGESKLVPRRIDLSHTPSATADVSAIHIRLLADELETGNP